MAEEETGLQTEEKSDTDSQTATETPETKTEEVDWEQRYKDTQAEYTRTQQRVADLEAQAVAKTEQSEQEADEEEYPGFVDEKKVGKMIEAAISGERQRSAESYFRRAYPELRDDESVISGILRDPKHRSELLKLTSSEDRVDFAVKKFNDRLAKATATAKEEAETTAKEREEKNRKAQGLGGPSTTPTKSDDEGLSDADELSQRKARQAKKKTLA